MTTLLDLLGDTKRDEANLLERRMTVLRLDVEAWARSEPAMLGDLQRTCAGCLTRRQCVVDLVAHFDEPTWTGWREYCPNAAKLRMLSALQSFLRSGLPIEQAAEQIASHPLSAPVETD